ncbi:hypothetical protein [uncultured Maritimibacter sp.]|jgi:hypothetical protein|uniref:hypothetical protein n=1 Tax=uncultured Maritimibacter sp. TaxID=991866 RepID=UPI00261D440C|nr:hypothetical protein [uncultured Maritimibacter sp.]
MPETFSITTGFSKLPLAEIARARAKTAVGPTARLSALAQLVLFGVASFGLGTLAVIRFGPLDYDAPFFRSLIPLAGLVLGCSPGGHGPRPTR